MAAKKTTKKPEEDKNLKKLVTKGKRRGYLTQKEILEIYPSAEEDIEQLDTLYEKLLNVGVDVYDVESEKEAEKIKEEKEIDLTKLEPGKTRSTDPVRMYLREIGKVDLLTKVLLGKKPGMINRQLTQAARLKATSLNGWAVMHL